MKKKYLFALVMCSSLFVAGIQAQKAVSSKEKQSKGVLIKNGEDVLIENHAYQADLGGCGGTILGPKWILTAEHCVGSNSEIIGKEIGVGYTKRSNRRTGQTSIVKSVTRFSCWECDLSLLELEEPLDLSGKYAKAIRYASADVFTEGYVNEGMECYATGWGRLGPNLGSPDHLQGALLKFDKVQLSDDRIRVNETEGRLVCIGDSGGPLVVFNKDKSERIVVGAVSGGEGTPCTDYGFWGNVANAASWIEEVTGIKPYTEGTGLGIIGRDKKANFNVWPTPANDVIHIASKNKIKTIKVYDLSGKEVLQSSEISSVPLGTLSSGTYIIQDVDSLSSTLFVIKR